MINYQNGLDQDFKIFIFITYFIIFLGNKNYQYYLQLMTFSYRQAQKVNTILELIASSIDQSKSEIKKQQKINQEIVQQLLQSDVLAQIHDHTSTKLINYQLILYFMQNNPENIKTEQNIQFKCCQKIMSLLEFIKNILEQIVQQNVQQYGGVKSNTSQGKKHQRSTKEKYKIFVSCVTKYERYLAQLKKNKQLQNQEDNDQVMMEQLEKLVLKQEEGIKQLQNQKLDLKQRISSMQKISEQLKIQRNRYFEQKNYLFDQNEELKQQIVNIIKQSIQNKQNKFLDYEQNRDVIAEIHHSKKKKQNDNDMMMCLLAQASTIQNFLS